MRQKEEQRFKQANVVQTPVGGQQIQHVLERDNKFLTEK